MTAIRRTVAVCFLMGIFSVIRALREAACSPPTYGVYVSVSSQRDLVGGGAVQFLVVNWFGMEVKEGDHVQLVNIQDKILMDHLVTKSEGSVTSGVPWDVSLIPENLDNLNKTELCLNYTVKYMRNNTMLNSSCLSLRPYWMEFLKEDLRNISITKIALPGSHNAGASTYWKVKAMNNLAEWTYTQDESLWQQLVIGARYLDIRIGFYDSLPEKFYVIHGGMPIAPLKGYINDVVKFINQTEEIIIFDIHELNEGFRNNLTIHKQLITLLENSFKQWMALRTLEPNPLMGNLWGNNTRLIVTYAAPQRSTSIYLWAPVHHLWGNVQNMSGLREFFNTNIPLQVNRGSLWSVMAEYTPSAADVIDNRWGGLQGAANDTNLNVTKWLRQDWWDKVNIVAMDFLLSSDVVNVCVEANTLRKHCIH